MHKWKKKYVVCSCVYCMCVCLHMHINALCDTSAPTLNIHITSPCLTRLAGRRALTLALHLPLNPTPKHTEGTVPNLHLRLLNGAPLSVPEPLQCLLLSVLAVSMGGIQGRLGPDQAINSSSQALSLRLAAEPRYYQQLFVCQNGRL